MNRRDFLKQSVVATGLGTTAARAAAASSPTPKRPNLLLIHTDQQSSWTLSCYAGERQSVPNYGRTLVSTPNIDRLAREGARLTRFFTNSAVCTPSRGCLFTGRYPHSHGAHRNDIPMNRDEQTIARVLAAAGYDTGYCGKWHLDGKPKPGFMTPERSMGFADCRFMFNRGHWKKMEVLPDGSSKAHDYNVIGDATTYTTDWLTNHAIDFINQQRQKPFFYTISIPDPHTPFTVREPYMSMYSPEDMPVPRTFQVTKAKKGRPRDEQWMKMHKARYCGLVKCIDDNVGRLLGALKRQGILDQTIVVFTTDHGEYMGEHGLYGKNHWYRTAYELPFLVRWPSAIPANRALDAFCSTVDVQPTLLDLMGVPASGREQGASFAPALRGEPQHWPQEVMIHHSSLTSAGIFTPTYELVLRKNGRHMLFDRLADPEQATNLAERPEQAARFAKLKARIIAHHEEVESPALGWLKDDQPATGAQTTGIVYEKNVVEADTRGLKRAGFTRLMTTPQGIFRAELKYRVSFDYESVGLDNKNSHFYFTLRPGNDRKAQTGPLYWDAAKGETGRREHLLTTGEFSDYVLIIGVRGQGKLIVRNLRIERLP